MTSKAAIEGLPATPSNAASRAHVVRLGVDAPQTRMVGPNAEDVDRISRIRPRSMGFPRLPASSSALLRRKTRPIARGTRSNFFERFGAQ